MSKKKPDPALTRKFLDMLGDDDSELGKNIKSMLPIFNTVFSTLLTEDKKPKKDLFNMSSTDEDDIETVPYTTSKSAIKVNDYEIPTDTWKDLIDIAKKYMGAADAVGLIPDEDNDQTMCDADGNPREESEPEYTQEQIELVAEFGALAEYHVRRIRQSFVIVDKDIVTNVGRYKRIENQIQDTIDKIYNYATKMLVNHGVDTWTPQDIKSEFEDVTDDELAEIVNDSQYYHYFELIG